MATPARRDLVIVRNDSYAHEITFVDDLAAPLDVSNRTWAAQIRSDPTSTGTADAVFSVDTTSAASGVIVLGLTTTDTAALRANRTYRWDLQATTGSDVTTMVAGSVTVVQDVTR